MEKSFFRQQCLRERAIFSEEYIDIVSQSILEKFLSILQYEYCKNLFIYLNFGQELNTRFIIDRALQDGKNIYCPFLINEKRKMAFKKFNGYENLTKNKYGILEPTSEEKLSDEDTIIIVPCLAFEKNGHRIGYGGGYYDYFLDNNKYLLSIGLCFEKFFVSEFDLNRFDKPLDMIITEKNIYSFGKERDEF